MRRVRNEGASLGISPAATSVARRAQFHRARLMEHVNLFNPRTTATLDPLTAVARSNGLDPVTARLQAHRILDGIVQTQAAPMSYFELSHLYAIGLVLVIPPVSLTRRPVAELGAAPVH